MAGFHSAFHAGRNAFYLGTERDKCPWGEEHPSYRQQWLKGFDDAAEEYRGGMAEAAGGPLYYRP